MIVIVITIITNDPPHHHQALVIEGLVGWFLMIFSTCFQFCYLTITQDERSRETDLNRSHSWLLMTRGENGS